MPLYVPIYKTYIYIHIYIYISFHKHDPPLHHPPNPPPPPNSEDGPSPSAKAPFAFSVAPLLPAAFRALGAGLSFVSAAAHATGGLRRRKRQRDVCTFMCTHISYIYIYIYIYGSGRRAAPPPPQKVSPPRGGGRSPTVRLSKPWPNPPGPTRPTGGGGRGLLQDDQNLQTQRAHRGRRGWGPI